MKRNRYNLTNAPSTRRFLGVTLLELLVTLLIVAMILTAVVGILSQVRGQMSRLDLRLSRRAALQHSFDRMLSDIVSSSEHQAQLQVETASFGELATSHLIIGDAEKSNENQAYHRIDWVAAPRLEEEDLVLFRREIRISDEDDAVFVPFCDNLYSFEVDLMDTSGEALDDPNSPYAMLEVRAGLFTDDDRSAERVTMFSRTFCLNRFQYDPPDK
ncbi:MAG: hypothetical protein JW709_02910 [Sedimentisphaerales bacterium]|nr:hypothetical protein [Sedimentisphaerales bacterium]